MKVVGYVLVNTHGTILGGQVTADREEALAAAVQTNAPGDLDGWLAPIRVDDLEWRLTAVLEQTDLDQRLLARLAELET